jgi:hypothetical protein
MAHTDATAKDLEQDAQLAATRGSIRLIDIRVQEAERRINELSFALNELSERIANPPRAWWKF